MIYQPDYRTTLPFLEYEWIGFADLERCPYASFSSDPYQRLKASQWYSEADKRRLWKTLDRYADFLQKKICLTQHG